MINQLTDIIEQDSRALRRAGLLKVFIDDYLKNNLDINFREYILNRINFVTHDDTPTCSIFRNIICVALWEQYEQDNIEDIYHPYKIAKAILKDCLQYEELVSEIAVCKKVLNWLADYPLWQLNDEQTQYLEKDLADYIWDAMYFENWMWYDIDIHMYQLLESLFPETLEDIGMCEADFG